MADGEADDGCAVGASQRHTEKSRLGGDADGFCPTGPDFPGEQVREQRGKESVCRGGYSYMALIIYKTSLFCVSAFIGKLRENDVQTMHMGFLSVNVSRIKI